MHYQAESDVSVYERQRGASGLPTSSSSNGLSRRDYFVLPLLSLLTVTVMLAAAEMATRLIWTQGGSDGCVGGDSLSGPKRLPNCAFRRKEPESPWITYSFNNCGYRTLESCGPKPNGTVRIALVGASISEGYLIPYQQTFSTETAEMLTRACHKPVEVQNMGVDGCSPTYASRRIDDALAMHPDAIVYALNAYDVEHDRDPYPPDEKTSSAGTRRTNVDGAGKRLIEDLRRIGGESRALLVAQHFLFQDPQLYVDLYVRQGDHAGYLRSSFPPVWEAYFADLELRLRSMAQKAHAAHVPLIVMAIPERSQAALFSLKNPPAGVDAFAFERRISQIAGAEGAYSVDAFSDFSREPHPEKMFYVVDTHLSPGGNVVITRALTRGLFKIPIPALSSCGVQ